MNSKLLRNTGFIFIILSFLFAIVLIVRQSDVLKFKQAGNKNLDMAESKLVILYPKNKTIFPPEIASPTFRWGMNLATKNWLINFSTSGKNIYSAYVFVSAWKPDSSLWERVKNIAKNDDVWFSVSTKHKINDSLVDLSAQIVFNFSVDSVNAPLFFRQLDLPFEFTRSHLTTIQWCLGEISNYSGAKTLITNSNTCGNCHSFSSNGEYMGIDFDYRKDRGGYASFPILKETKIEKQHFHSWNDRSEGAAHSSGLLSALSPNGRYVVGTVKDQSVSSLKNNTFRFFPIKGVLSIYDRLTNKSWELQGANDSEFVQCNAVWSNDGKTLVFAKAKVPNIQENGNVLNDLAEGKVDFKYDLWSIPFNDGKGGVAMPVLGASENGKSNYFPKVSPNGKWIVFTQANSYMLRQLDSKLLIVPFEGGIARELESNLSFMNSWHSWSPNSKWLAFSTKGFSEYTKIALTHINDFGFASPAIFLENMVNETRAANIPEFVNIKFNEWNSVSLDFLDFPEIECIDIKKINNGVFQGESLLTGVYLRTVSVKLEVKIESGRIVTINIIESKNLTEKVEKLISKIIDLQTLDLNVLDANETEDLVIINAISDGFKIK